MKSSVGGDVKLTLRDRVDLVPIGGLLVGMLLNTATGRYHPIVLRPAPFPGGTQPPGGERFRSVGHHTKGFDTVEEARGWVDAYGGQRVDKIWVWDGSEVPAMTALFTLEEIGAQS